MTDISITAANVIAGSNATIRHGTAGATITAGQVVYLDQATTGRWKLADGDSASAESRAGAVAGIALNGASDGQPIAVQTAGDITIGGTLTAGDPYYLSGTAGGICPAADVTGGVYNTLLGLASSATVLALDIQYSGVASA